MSGYGKGKWIMEALGEWTGDSQSTFEFSENQYKIVHVQNLSNFLKENKPTSLLCILVYT